MKKAVVIGGYGHIGSYVVPKLVDNGYDVTVVSRGNRKPYNYELPIWDKVKSVVCDRKQMSAEGKFGNMIAQMKPDLIFDAVCFTKEHIEELCTAIVEDTKLSSKTKLIAIGSIWVYGHKIYSPVTEEHPRNAYCNYGKGKSDIENYLHSLSESGRLNTTILHPGHISGDGWYPINPQGNVNPSVYSDIISGKEILLPDDGNATLHHVHSEDIADLTMAVLEKPDVSCGEAFNATAKYAVTLRGFAKELYKHFGHKPNISYLPFKEFEKKIDESDAGVTYSHIHRSPNCSMEKAEKLLGFVPRHSILDTVISALNYKISKGDL